MLRRLHATPGLIAALLLMVVALTGALLSVFPALERAAARPASGLDVATLAARVDTRVPAVESLVREASGAIIAYHLAGETQRVSLIDPASGAAVAAYAPSALQRWVRNLHRRLLLDEAGRVATGVAAAGLAVIALSGLALLVRRMGGWRQLAGPVRGSPAAQWHDRTARWALAGLLLSATTGVLMSLASFGLLPEGGSTEPLPEVPPGAAVAMALERMPALKAVDVSQLRQLKLAARGDPGDVIELETTEGAGTIDPATGAWLTWVALDNWQRLHATVRMLHTGDGLWWLALLLGASSLAVPVLAVTGALLWWRRRQDQPHLAGNAAAADAETVLLVGSETLTTWGFAAALHTALVGAGLKVHTAAMNDVAQRHPRLRRLLVLTSTYGDGVAPESARRFLPDLPALPAPAGVAFAVLGFGDRQFADFCGYARQVHAALLARGFEALCEPGTVDRQSEAEFLAWCEGLGRVLGVALDVRYTPRHPRTRALRLVSRTDYGSDPQTLAAVLRFGPAAASRRWTAGLGLPRLPRFETGDLLGVMPPGGAAPRFYSLASGARDGVVEICVRRQPGGLCSRYLTDLQPGATIEAFIRPNARFRPAAGDQPVILIGAGTGIGPLIGFVRHNPPQRPMYLYFGARHAEDDFIHGEELQGLLGQRRLRRLITAFSRSVEPAYVQDRLLADAKALRQLIAQGAHVMVCGGRRMAEGVAKAWERILAGGTPSLAQLRTEGRYVEDVY